MSGQDWTLEKELIGLSGATSLPDALVSLNLISDVHSDFELSTVADWARSGSETYLFRFKVESPMGDFRNYVLKACVAYSPSLTLEAILDEWVDRRRLLQRLGVNVPRLHASGNGIILEEAIPYTLLERLKDSSADHSLLSHGLAEYIGILSGLGFAAVSPFFGLLSRGHDVVAVDFGADLGKPQVAKPGDFKIFDELIEFLEDFGVAPNPGLRSTFTNALARGLDEISGKESVGN